MKLEAQLKEQGIPHKSIREPDAPYCGALMAIGIEPMDRERLKPTLRRLPLLKELRQSKEAQIRALIQEIQVLGELDYD